MIKRKKINKYLQKHLQGIQQSLFEMKDDIDKDELHKLRVHSKKVKAATALLKEVHHKKKEYSTKKLQELFRHAGGIRTAQLNLETIQEAGIKNTEFKKNQQAIIDNDAKELAGKTKKYRDQLKKLEMRFAKNISGIKNNQVASFYHDSLTTLKKNLAAINEDQLHDSRKIIKKLLYNVKLLNKPLAKKLPLNIEYLDNLQELIGKWHDSVVTIDLLTGVGNDKPINLAKLKKTQKLQLQKVTDAAKNFEDRVAL